LADGFGTVESVARDVIKAEDIVDYTVKENFADRLAKRFAVDAMSALGFLMQSDRLSLH
jgi:protease IV